MIIFCPTCLNRVGGYVSKPVSCAYCGTPMPINLPVIAEPLKQPVTAPQKKPKQYRLSENDRRLLRSIRIDPDV